MSYIVLSVMSLFMIGCPLAMGQDASTNNTCVVDQCDDGVCSIETPEGWVDVLQNSNLEEGKKIDCPTWIVDPT